MAVTDLHSLDISTAIDKIFSTGQEIPGAVLSLVRETPTINVGDNVPLVMSGRAKGALVHESGTKPDNGRTVVAKPFTTVKLVYSQRVTDEFLLWAEERQADFISRLVSDWTRKSLPRDIDTVVLHGVDPNTGTVDSDLSDYILKSGSHVVVPSTGTTASDIDTDFGSAVAALADEGYRVNGVAISDAAAQSLATITEGNEKKYPGLGVFGLTSGTIAGRAAASSPEVGEYNDVEFVMGDWDQLSLGFAGSADWKVIEYGNPDGGTHDLQNVNQVCIRLELKFGFRVLDANAFAVVSSSVTES